jgi:hypothetical protein
LTRPSTFDPLGFTYGPAGFIRETLPDRSGCGALWQANEPSTLWDANVSDGQSYFSNTLDAWAPQYLLADYLRRTKGVSLISDAVPIPDYIRQYVYTSPYNIRGLHTWYSGTTTVFNTWLGTTGVVQGSFLRSVINFKDHYPGITFYRREGDPAGEGAV